MKTKIKPPSKRNLQTAAFILRCSGSSAFGYILAEALALPYPLWTAISAIVVSQERLIETKSSVTNRILGTLLGVCVAVIADGLAQDWGWDQPVRILFSVALCAAATLWRPSLRASMVTCPIVLLTAMPHEPMYMVGFYRGCEVILGGLLANLAHVMTDKGLSLLEPPVFDPTPKTGRSGR